MGGGVEFLGCSGLWRVVEKSSCMCAGAGISGTSLEDCVATSMEAMKMKCTIVVRVVIVL